MMRAIGLAIVCSLLIVPGRALAQEAPSPSEAPPAAPASGTPTPDEDIHCAAWTSIVAGTSNTKEVVDSFGLSMNYFLGRYEGATGEDFVEPMYAALVEFDNGKSSMAAYEAICLPRAKAFAQREIDLGKKAADQGAAAKAEVPPGAI